MIFVLMNDLFSIIHNAKALPRAQKSFCLEGLSCGGFQK